MIISHKIVDTTSISKSKPESLWKYIDKDAIEFDSSILEDIFNIAESVYVDYVQNTNKKKVIFARVINLLTGLLLTTPHNPFSSLIEYLSPTGYGI